MTSQQHGRLTAKVSTNIMEHIFLVLSTTDNFLNTENCVLYFRNHVHHFFLDVQVSWLGQMILSSSVLGLIMKMTET